MWIAHVEEYYMIFIWDGLPRAVDEHCEEKGSVSMPIWLQQRGNLSGGRKAF